MRAKDQSRQGAKQEKIEADLRRPRWRRSKGDTRFHESSLILRSSTVAGNVIANPSRQPITDSRRRQSGRLNGTSGTTSSNKPSNKRSVRVINNQTPGTMTWPGAAREFQFPEYIDSGICIKRSPPRKGTSRAA